MTYDTEPKKLHCILENTSLAAILTKATLIEKLNMALTRYLSSQLMLHCQVLNYENSIVVIGVDNAHWITQLRYDEPTLVQYFRTQTELPNVLGIKYKIRF